MRHENHVQWFTRLRNSLHVDRHAGLLALLLLIAQGGAVWLAQALTSVNYEPATPVGGPDASATESAAAGAAWAGLEVAFAAGLLAALVVYRRLPDWGQKIVKMNAIVLFFLYLGSSWGQAGVIELGAAMCVGLVSTVIIADQFDIWWVFNNLLAVLLAMIAGGYVAIIFGIWGLVVALAGLTIYDHVFANQRDWMFEIMDFLLRLRVPVIIFIPPTWRFDWAELTDDEDDDDDFDDDSVWGIGMADLALPAAFAAAVAVAPVGGLVSGGTLAALGVVAGVTLAAFRIRWQMLTKGSGAGLPALTVGALGGWVVMQLVIGFAALVLA